MKTKSTGKMSRLFSVILRIIFFALVLTVVLQYRYITRLKSELDINTDPESGQSGLDTKDNPSILKSVNPPSDVDPSHDEDISDKEKIKKLESQIADMQAWQNYLEDSLKKQNKEEDWKNEITNDAIRSMLSSPVDAFAEEAGLPSDIKKKLLDILTERKIEIQDLISGDIPQEDRKQEAEIITIKYNELISDLLADKYTAYREYQLVEEEREYVIDFKSSMLSDDNQLEKHQERMLIDAIYNDNQMLKEMLEEKRQILYNEKISNIEKKEKYLEIQKTLYSRYMNSAREILTESQLQKFQKYLDIEMARHELYVNKTISQLGSIDE